MEGSSEMPEQWQQILASMPESDVGGREPVEPAASAVVAGFLRDVHRFFQGESIRYRNAGLEAHVEPSSVAEINSDSTVGLTVSVPDKSGSSHTLHCKRKIPLGLDVRLLIDREQLWQEWSSFALDRKPESPWIFVESSFAAFDKKVQREG